MAEEGRLPSFSEALLLIIWSTGGMAAAHARNLSKSLNSSLPSRSATPGGGSLRNRFGNGFTSVVDRYLCHVRIFIRTRRVKQSDFGVVWCGVV